MLDLIKRNLFSQSGTDELDNFLAQSAELDDADLRACVGGTGSSDGLIPIDASVDVDSPLLDKLLPNKQIDLTPITGGLT